MRKRIIGVLVAVSAFAVFASIGLTGSVHAAPAKAPNAGLVSADCGADGDMEFLVNFANNGNWSPAFRTGTNQVFIPIAFGPSVGTFTDAAGNDHPADDPGGTKATPRNGAHVLNCTYHIDVLIFGGHLVADGTATGFLTPAHP